MLDKQTENIPWYKEHYVWMIIFFPVLAIIGGIITLDLAIKSNDGLVVDDYYKEGLEINKTLERDHIAAAYHLQADIQLDQEFQQVTIKLNANSGFIYPENLSVTFLHSTRSGFDKDVRMVLTEDSIYRGNLPKLIPGKWYIYIQHDDWRLIKTINIQ